MVAQKEGSNNMKRTVMKNSLLDSWPLYGLKYRNNSENKKILIDEINPT